MAGVFAACMSFGANAQTYMEYVDSADNYIKRERWADAERATVAALQLKPANKLNFHLWSNLGDIRTRLGDYDGALQAFDIALASRPESPKVLCGRAYTYLEMGETSKAMSDIDKAIEKDSTLAWPMRMRGTLLIGLGKYDEAERDFMRLKKVHPDDAGAFKGLGKIEAARGNSAKAIEYLRKSLDREKDDDTWFYLIMVLIEDDKLREAKEELLVALKRYPRNGNLYLLRGVIHKKNYENEQAEIDKKIALEYGADPHLVENYFPASVIKN